MYLDIIVSAVDFVCHLFLLAHAYVHLRQAQDEGHESVKAESEKAESEKAESEKAESEKAESVKAESVKAESEKAESVKAESVKMSRVVIVAGIYLISYLGLAICAFIHLGEKLAELA